jgi:TDG/mug DNA glycosylase family protein
MFSLVEKAMTGSWRPSRDQVLSAQDKTVPDLVAPGLAILFTGINPSLYSAAVGHHFARPGNRFWPAIHAAGFTPRLFSPFEDRSLLDLGYGITNIVDRATASADGLSATEFVVGGRQLEEKILRFRPKLVAFLGITAYRTAFDRPRAMVGLQPETVSDTSLWVLPNPSGLNAHYRVPDLVRLFEALRKAAELRAV